jgi:hypothetical protein
MGGRPRRFGGLLVSVSAGTVTALSSLKGHFVSFNSDENH